MRVIEGSRVLKPCQLKKTTRFLFFLEKIWLFPEIALTCCILKKSISKFGAITSCKNEKHMMGAVYSIVYKIYALIDNQS